MSNIKSGWRIFFFVSEFIALPEKIQYFTFFEGKDGIDFGSQIEF